MPHFVSYCYIYVSFSEIFTSVGEGRAKTDVIVYW